MNINGIKMNWYCLEGCVYCTKKLFMPNINFIGKMRTFCSVNCSTHAISYSAYPSMHIDTHSYCYSNAFFVRLLFWHSLSKTNSRLIFFSRSLTANLKNVRPIFSLLAAILLFEWWWKQENVRLLPGAFQQYFISVFAELTINVYYWKKISAAALSHTLSLQSVTIWEEGKKKKKYKVKFITCAIEW